MALTAKERHRIKLIEYLGNTDNDFPTRSFMAVSVLGYKQHDAMYKIFTPDDLTEIEKEALEIRRTKYARYLAGVDMAQLKKALDGDTAAAQLVYKRLEGWSEKIKGELSGPNEGPIEMVNNPPAPKSLSEWEEWVKGGKK